MSVAARMVATCALSAMAFPALAAVTPLDRDDDVVATCKFWPSVNGKIDETAKPFSAVYQFDIGQTGKIEPDVVRVYEQSPQFSGWFATLLLGTQQHLMISFVRQIDDDPTGPTAKILSFSQSHNPGTTNFYLGLISVRPNGNSIGVAEGNCVLDKFPSGANRYFELGRSELAKEIAQ